MRPSGIKVSHLRMFGRFFALLLILQVPINWASLPAYAMSLCPDAETIVSTTPAPPPFPSRMLQLESILSSAPADPDIVVVGDSIAAGWPVNFISQQLGVSEVFNFGLGSDQTQNVLWRLGAPQLAKMTPEVVVVAVGTNNVRIGETCGVVSGVQAVISKVHEIWPGAQVAVLSILYKGAYFQQNRDEITKVNSSLQDLLHNDSRVIFFHPNSRLYCGLPEYSNTIAKHLFVGLSNLIPVCGNFAGDWVHLHSSGYSELTAALRSSLKR